MLKLSGLDIFIRKENQLCIPATSTGQGFKRKKLCSLSPTTRTGVPDTVAIRLDTLGGQWIGLDHWLAKSCL